MLPLRSGCSNSGIAKWIARVMLTFLSILLLVGAGSVPAQASPLLRPQPGRAESGPGYVPREILVKFKVNAGIADMERVNQQCEATIRCSTSWGMKRLRLPEDASVWDAAARYRQNPHVEYAEPNYTVQASMVPNDPLYQTYQWHLKRMNMEKAWDIATGRGVIVAVLDTGVAYDDYGDYRRAPDLAQTSFVAGYDFVNDDSHPNDDEGHGTHIAGSIAQSTNNRVGAAGVAYGSRIMPVKVLGSDGSGNHADIAAGIHYAVDHGAKVINLSLGGTDPSSTLEEAVAYAYKNGVTVVVATGNRGRGTADYPAAYDKYVIAVGATDYNDSLAPYSNYGKSVDIVAPGGNLRVDGNDDGYGDGVLQETFGSDPQSFDFFFLQGTSMAAANVSGICALLISRGTSGPDKVRQALQSTAKDLGHPGRDDKYGWGVVDAHAALTGGSTTKLPTIPGDWGKAKLSRTAFPSFASVTTQGDEAPGTALSSSNSQLEVGFSKSRFSPVLRRAELPLPVKVKTAVEARPEMTSPGERWSFQLEFSAISDNCGVEAIAKQSQYARQSLTSAAGIKGAFKNLRAKPGAASLRSATSIIAKRK